MSLKKFSRPVDPLVARNEFRERAYDGRTVPDFAAVKPHLPQPVVPDEPAWEALYWWAWEKAWQNVQTPAADSGLVNVFIDSAFNGRLFMWDAAFISQFAFYARRAFDSMGVLDNFYACQHNDGFICREIDATTGEDFFHPFDPNGTGPNILAWAEWRYFRQTGDESRLNAIFAPLVAYHRWCRANRTWQNGLYWATGMSSAMDNQPRVPDSNLHHRHWSWVDATMQASLNCMVLEQLATLLDRRDVAQEMSHERAALQQQANQLLWNEDAQFYQDIDANGRFSAVKSIGTYWALLDKEMVPAQRMQPLVQHLRDNWSFNLSHRVPSQSADSDGYNVQSGNYWRGAVWPSANFMVLKGLRTAGVPKLAHAIAVNHLTHVSAVFRQTGTVWENYAPETTSPGDPAKPDFVGASGLTPISILLEDVIGISVDWPQRRVTWDRWLDTASSYGVRNLPLGGEGTMTLLGDNEGVTVETDVPFTLVIRDSVQSLQTAVPAGVTEIALD